MVAEAPPHIAVQVQLAPRQVVGFPVHAWVSFVIERAELQFSEVPFVDTWSTPSAIGVRIETGDPKHPLGRAPRHDPELVGYRLTGPASLRCLVDLSPMIPPGIHPGRYRISIGYAATPRSTLWSPPTDIVFEQPTDHQREVLQVLGPQAEQAGTWASWAEVPTDDVDALRQPIADDDPLRLYRIYRRLHFDPAPLASVDLRIAAPLDGFYEAQAGLLRAELMLARGGYEEARAIAEGTIDRFPGMQAWFTDLFDNGSPTMHSRDLFGVEVPMPSS